MTMIGFFPPISSAHFLPARAQAIETCRPTSVDPVKVTRSTSGCSTSGAPASSP